jgi:AAA15 family ATPase/GTPase
MDKRKVPRNSDMPIEKLVLNDTKKIGHHFESISIDKYKCFNNFSIDSFKRVNLIGGKNNVGKSSFLEAFFLLMGATNINLLLNINAFRGIEVYEGKPEIIREMLWNHLFNAYSSDRNISIVGEIENRRYINLVISSAQIDQIYTSINGSILQNGLISTGKINDQTLQFKYKDENGKKYIVEMKVENKGISIPPPSVSSPYRGIFVPSNRRLIWPDIASRYGQLELSNNEFDLVSALTIIEPRLKKLSTIMGASGPMIYGDIGVGRMLPLAEMGDGLMNLMDKLLAITTVPHGVVLMDEVENGFHYSILDKVWKIFDQVSQKYDVQIIATTHSWECIKSAHNNFITDNYYDFSYHRLEKFDDNIVAISLTQDTLQTTIDSGWEIR